MNEINNGPTYTVDFAVTTLTNSIARPENANIRNLSEMTLSTTQANNTANEDNVLKERILRSRFTLQIKIQEEREKAKTAKCPSFLYKKPINIHDQNISALEQIDNLLDCLIEKIKY